MTLAARWARSPEWISSKPTIRCARSPRNPAANPSFPRFSGEFHSISRAFHEARPTKYSLGYAPSTTAKDGKFGKIKVELVNPANNEPLRITDEKGKPIKYTIVAKSGYTAPREVE